MSKRKDMEALVKAVEKYLQPVADKDTYDRRDSKHINISFLYHGCPVKLTFSKSPRTGRSLKSAYAEVKRELRHCGMDPTGMKMKMVGRPSEDSLIGQFFDELEKMEPLLDDRETLSGMDDPYKQQGVSGYLTDARRTQRQSVRANLTNKKPYKKRISYIRNEEVISYTRYYVWRKIVRSDDSATNGYFSSRKDEYDFEMKKYKKKNKK